MSSVHLRLTELLRDNVLVIDGAMGTSIQQFGLSPADFGGVAFEGCNEYLSITRPDLISSIHRSFLDAGAHIIETNTFGASRVVLAEYGLESLTRSLNFESARLAKLAAQSFPDRFVAGSIGPTTKSLSVTRDISFDLLCESYLEQVLGLIEGGCDLLFVETCQDTLNTKAAVLAVQLAQSQLRSSLPVFISVSILDNGRMFAGQDVEAFFISVRHLNPFAVGINCALGSREVLPAVRQLSSISDLPVFVFPNAGMPDQSGRYTETPDLFAANLSSCLQNRWVNLVGGCCGTTHSHIHALAALVRSGSQAFLPSTSQPTLKVSGYHGLVLSSDSRPLIIGERTNVQGSRRFRDLLRERRLEEALSVAKDQISGGAHLLDICLADTEFDEVEMARLFYPSLARAIKAPLVVDTTNPEVLRVALTHVQGKSIVNSVNLENGLEGLEPMLTLAQQFGVALIVGLIDEAGLAKTLSRKLEVADRLYTLLTEHYHVAPENIIFDPLVLTITSSTEQDNYALASLDAIPLLKERFPLVSTVLGISNVSHGFSPPTRAAVNTVFLQQALKRGLDLAIINPTSFKRFHQLSSEELGLVEAVLAHPSQQSFKALNDYYVTSDGPQQVTEEVLTTPSDRLQHAIINGSRSHLGSDLRALLAELPATEIINQVVMQAMAQVGKLFDRGELIITEVLESSEVVREVIAHLQPHLPKEARAARKKIILATVKGDVHDIGKSLIKMILSSNGFEVVDLGTKVDSLALVQAVRRHQPDAIGLSGLLIKSAHQMIQTAADLREEGISLPIVVGGAVLTRKFVVEKIQPAYNGPVRFARSAMDGLHIFQELLTIPE